MKNIYRVKINSSNNSPNKLVILFSIVFIIMSILLILNGEKAIGIILIIIGILLLLITKSFKTKSNYKVTYYDNQTEFLNDIEQHMNRFKETMDLDDISNAELKVTEKTYDKNGVTAHYVKKEYKSSKVSVANKFDKKRIEELKDFYKDNTSMNIEDARKIRNCPNCGADNLIRGNIDRCQYCGSFIE